MINNYSVRLEECDKITAIKVYREITGVGLKEAKSIIDNIPCIIFNNLSLDEANDIVNRFKSQNCPASFIRESNKTFSEDSGRTPDYEGPDVTILRGKALIDALAKAKETIFKVEQLQVNIEGIDNSIAELKAKAQSLANKSGAITYLGTIICAVLGIVIFQFIGLVVGIIAGWFVSGIIDSIVNGDKNSEKSKVYYDTNYPPLERKRNELTNEARRLLHSKEFVEAQELIPADYFDSKSVEYMLRAVENRRAESLKESINLYEEYLFRSRIEELQKQQVELAKESADAQKEIAKAAKQQAESSKEIARNTRATVRAVKLNTFINFIKD